MIPFIIPYYSYFNIKSDFVIPEFLSRDIQKINRTSGSDLEYLKNIYNFLTKKYYGDRVGSVLAINKSFKNTVERESGLLPCNIFNELFSSILIDSGRFDKQDINRVVVPLNFFIHQYLKVKINKEWVNIDPTYSKRGVVFGERAFLFR